METTIYNFEKRQYKSPYFGTTVIDSQISLRLTTNIDTHETGTPPGEPDDWETQVNQRTLTLEEFDLMR